MRNLEKRINKTYYTPQVGSLSYYLVDISKYKILSKKDLKPLLVKAKRGDLSAVESIVNSNQRFVFALAKRFSGGNTDLLCDLITEANIGLINAIKQFNTERDNSFLTYAVYWMQKEIFSYISFINPAIKASNKAKTAKLPEIKNRFMLLNGRSPTASELLCELKDKHGLYIIKESDVYGLQTISIDSENIPENYDDFSSYFFEENGFESENELGFMSNNSYNKEIDCDYSKAIISNSIGVLSDKEREVVELLYGINNYREYEIQEVAEKIGMTMEGIRMVNARALNKLKKNIIIKKETI